MRDLLTQSVEPCVMDVLSTSRSSVASSIYAARVLLEHVCGPVSYIDINSPCLFAFLFIDSLLLAVPSMERCCAAPANCAVFRLLDST